jgi:hypothetical protein
MKSETDTPSHYLGDTSGMPHRRGEEIDDSDANLQLDTRIAHNGSSHAKGQ